jgi:SNF2 family DNA or RNA helicase
MIEITLHPTKDNRVVFTGNTYEYREELKTTGAKWDPEDKVWWNYADIITLEIIQSKIGHLNPVFDPILLTILERKGRVQEEDLYKTKLPLHPYQIEGVKFLLMRERAILADEIGLGKTVQAICTAMTLKGQGKIRKCLIVCPSSLKYQWKDEIEKFTEESALVIDGAPDERAEVYQNDSFFYIINYELVIRDIEQLSLIKFDLVVMDEATRIKSRAAKISKTLKKNFRTPYKIIISGTPLENQLDELYNIVLQLDTKLLGTYKEFEARHINFSLLRLPNLPYPIKKIKGYKHLDEVKAKVNRVMIRRKKEDVIKDLPDVMEQIRRIDWVGEHKAIYHRYREAVRDMISFKEEYGEVSDVRILAEVNMLKMLCDSTELLMLSDSKLSEAMKINKVVSSKVDELKNLLPELSEHKIIIFTQYARMLRVLKRELALYGPETLCGDDTAEERAETVKRFTENPDKRILIMTDAGTYGLNLQVADVVINFDLPWNPAKLSQRAGRCHRLGQKNVVNVISLVLKNSVEDNIINILYRKKKLFDIVVEGEQGDGIEFEKLTYKDLKELLI